MPFVNTALTSLVTNSGFSLWLYRTTDTRATVLVAGYFTPAAARLVAGDLIIVQAADSVSVIPVRISAQVAAGVVIDTTAAPFRVDRQSAQRFSVMQAASALVQTIVLAPLAAGLVSNGVVQASASVVGPVAQVSFSINDASGAVIRGPQLATVSGGTASATLAAPPVGTGYRMRVQATLDTAVADTSAPFAVTAPFSLLVQGGSFLLAQDGGRLFL